MRSTLPFLLFCFGTSFSFAQAPCAASEQLEWLRLHDSSIANRMIANSIVPDNPAFHKSLLAVPDTIPVVVHVINTGGSIGTPFNPSDADIHDMIGYMNQSFSATLPNYPSQGNGGVDVGIFFQLAQTNPSCQLSNGIIRINASGDAEYMANGISFGGGTGGITHTQLAAKSYWNSTRYLNIWLVNKFSNSYYAGYAYFPTGTQSVYDGIVMVAGYTNGPYVITHEAGHYFNLYHTFQGQYGTDCPVNNNCNTDGDHVCDTPPVLINSGGPTAINPCNNQPYGTIGSNYMSYESHNHFTALQRDRMRAALFTYRSSLLAADTEWPPPQSPGINISSNNPDNIICNNQSITFTATISGGASQVSYQWLKNNIQVASTPTYTTNDLTSGDEISCSILANAPPCYTNASASSNKIIITVAALHPLITQDYYLLTTGFSAESSYSWHLNGQPIDGAINNSLHATTFGSYTVTETKLTCQATSDPVVIAPLTQQQQLVIVYPNPFSNGLHAQTASPAIKITGIRIITSDGKQLENKTIDNYSLLELPFKNAPAGVYVIQFNTNEGSVNVSVVKR